MIEIPLTKGLVALIDSEDMHIVGHLRWGASSGRTSPYAGRYFYDGGGKRRFVLMHRFIMGAPKDYQVDHIDGNTLNNQRSNLRFATASQNAFNRRMPKNNRTGYRGVYWYRGIYAAQIAHGGKPIWLGSFTDPEMAAAAYRNAAIRLFGEFFHD